MRIVCVRSLCRDLICIIAIVVVVVVVVPLSLATPLLRRCQPLLLLLMLCCCATAPLFCFSHSIIVAVFFINAISGNICAAPRLTLFQAREREREKQRDTHTQRHAKSRTSRPRNCSLTHFRTMRIPHTIHCPPSYSLCRSLALSLSFCKLMPLQLSASASAASLIS